MLLLGAVILFEPVNGYQIRRELISWHAEDWANINPGSIYNGLATLVKRGELVRHDLRDGNREVAVYESSELGRQEFQRLFESAITQVRPTAPLGFHTAFSMLPLVERGEAVRLLRERVANLERHIVKGSEPPPLAMPPHVVAAMGYWNRTAELERDWLRDLVEVVVGGGLEFRGEPMSWTPDPDDPGWQMDEDRARYRAMLGR